MGVKPLRKEKKGNRLMGNVCVFHGQNSCVGDCLSELNIIGDTRGGGTGKTSLETDYVMLQGLQKGATERV